MKNQEYLLLPPEEICNLLESEEINVPNEETIYHALVMWAKNDPSTRKAHLPRLLSLIKLPLLASQVSVYTVKPVFRDHLS